MNHYSILGEPDLPVDAFSPRCGGMTLHGKSSAPPAPDYKGAAEATAAGNLAAAQTATEANRVNQYNPYGSSVYTQTPGASTFDQAGYDAAMADYNKSLQSGGSQGTWVPGTQGVGMDGTGATAGYWTGGTSGSTATAPSRDAFTKTGNPTWSQTTSLSPVGQQLLDQQNKTSMGLAGLQDTATSRVAGQQAQGWNDSGIQGIGTPLNSNNLSARSNPLDVNGLPSMGKTYDPYSDTNTATQAIMSRLNPQIDRQRNMLSQQLANQGVAQGTEAYKNAYTDQGQRENDLMNQAALSGINLGLTQQGQTYNQTNANRLLGTNEQNQNLNQALTGRNQDIAEQGQNFNQSLAANQQGIQDQNYFANRDMNQLNALRSGSQVTNPTFSAVPMQGTTAGPDLYGAANSQYTNALSANNAKNANSASMLNGLFGLAGSFLGG